MQRILRKIIGGTILMIAVPGWWLMCTLQVFGKWIGEYGETSRIVHECRRRK